MKTSNRSAILTAALFLLALLAGCGSSSSSNTVPTVEQAFYEHSIVFSNNSTLLTAGYNEFGQLGNGYLTSPVSFVGNPVSLGPVHGYAAGANHTLAFGSNNPAFGNNSTIWAWGSNLHGRLGINGTTKVATAGNDAFVKYPTKILVPNTVVSIATGWSHSLAVAGPNRSVLSWGQNNYGQLGYPGDKQLQDIGFPVPVAGAGGTGTLDNIVQVAAGGTHSLALSNDGRVFSWGDNQFGQLGRSTFPATFGIYPNQVDFPSTANGKKVVQIAAAGSFSAALMDDGTVWEWGYNLFGQCGTTNLIPVLSAPTQVKLPDGTPFLASKISLGIMHSLALTSTGEVWAWGWNEKAQLGLSTLTLDNNVLSVYEPRKVSALERIGLAGVPASDIYAFGTVSFARINGTWYGWGDNGFGQLGKPVETKTIPLIFTPVAFKSVLGG